ncbi:MAG TPA: hypothetical protein IAC67_06300 [Candidatus Coproplasma excrementipullorum]|nr:hypothetical protein [Candidatus Coproplasma excrementipullorum]
MTAKEFFKSTAFKCIAVLLSIVLICGVLLTICNSLFGVSDAERLGRALAEIYGKEVTANVVELDDKETEYDYGTVNEAYHIEDDGNYLINVTATGGYPNGSGTTVCYVVVEMTDGAMSGIGRVVISSYSSAQNLMSSEVNKDSVLNAFSDFYDGNNFVAQDWTSSGLVSGATYSLTSVVNAVNTAMTFVRTQIVGEVIVDPFENFEYLQYINRDATTYEVLDDGSVQYNVLTTGAGNAGAFTITVTVGSDGTITDYNIVKNGSTDDHFAGLMHPAVLDGSLFIGKDLDGILDLFVDASGDTLDKDDLITDNVNGDQLVTGASDSSYDNAGYSNFLCVYAALFATANYDNAVAAGGNA